MEAILFDLNWRIAMEVKMAALHQNGTWELVLIPSLLVSKLLVVSGCIQLSLISMARLSVWRPDWWSRLYSKPLVLIIKILFLRLSRFSLYTFFFLAANLDWPLFHLDVKNVFLRDDLLEEVYILLDKIGSTIWIKF